MPDFLLSFQKKVYVSVAFTAFALLVTLSGPSDSRAQPASKIETSEKETKAGSTPDFSEMFFEKTVKQLEDDSLAEADKVSVVESVLANLNQHPEFQFKAYWNSVFLTFQCQFKDTHRLIPFCILKNLTEIKQGLHEAYAQYPTYHHYAPARTLAIMYFKMPLIVGGSKKKARSYMKEANDGDPDYPENRLWFERLRE